MTDIIIKAGGSLQKGKHLADICRKLGILGGKYRTIIIPGGGRFADKVRDCDLDFNLDQDTSHWMAILAMDQFGYLLSSLIPGSICTEDIDEAKEYSNEYRPAVLLPYRLIKDKDPLPHSWDVTSDSIAAWIAGYLNTKKLLLIKSKDLSADSYTYRDFKNPVDIEQLENTDIVDPMFCRIMRELGIDLWIINGNCPEQLTGLSERNGMFRDLPAT